MGNRFEEASKRAADQTNEELTTVLSSITNLPTDKIKSLFPTPTDQANLKELIDIVRGATNENDKVNKLREKAETCGKVALNLIRAYIKPL